jgi:hypothetical protein
MRLDRLRIQAIQNKFNHRLHPELSFRQAKIKLQPNIDTLSEESISLDYQGHWIAMNHLPTMQSYSQALSLPPHEKLQSHGGYFITTPVQLTQTEETLLLTSTIDFEKSQI